MKCGVLGGGALGLTVALRLLERGQEVVLFERESLPGGLAAGFKIGNVWLEKFYHHLFRSDRATIALINELGLGEKLVWPRPRTVTLYQGNVYQLDSPLTFLLFPPLRLPERLRQAAVMAFLRLLPNPSRLEGRTAATWLRRWVGSGPFETIWEPLLRAKFGALKDEIALPWFWARVHDRSSELGYLRGGFQQLYDRLEERVRALGGEVHFDTTVTSVYHAASGCLCVETTKGQHMVNRVVSTLPPRLTCQIVPEMPPDYRQRYDWGTAYGAHCVILELDRPLTESYWMNINDPGYPFMVVVDHTNYMPVTDYRGTHLVYLGNYRPMDDPLFRMNEYEILAEFLPHLKKINPAFSTDWLLNRWVFAAPFAQPIVTTEYREHIPPFETPVSGLFQASMFQVYPHDRGQNYSILMAEELVRKLVSAKG